MPWKPEFPGEIPTLGHSVLQWMMKVLAAPDKPEYEPFIPSIEQAQFILNFYALDPITGKRKIRRAVISRPKGWGKSPFLAAIGCAEALFDVVPAGWDANGRPVGMSWSQVQTPFVQFLAVSEDQTMNAWGPVKEMLREGPACDIYPGLEPLDGFVNLPYKGRMEYSTAAPTSKEGNKPIFAVFDQTESWTPSNHGVKLAETVRRNLGKTGGTSIEAPNAFRPGDDSVAERTAQFWTQIVEGKAKETGLYYDHREWPSDVDMWDWDSLIEGLRYVYGDSSGHMDGCTIHEEPCPPGWKDLERIAAEIWDPDTDPQDARQFYGNEITHAADAWLSQPQLKAISDPMQVVADGDTIVLGFDGSRKRSDRTTDATALVGCRVSDGHLFEIRVWEQPHNWAEQARHLPPEQRGWWVPTLEVEREVEAAFERWNVVGMYADPAADWRSYIAGWEAKYGENLLVKKTRDHPLEWWMGGQNLTQTWRAIQQFYSAVANKEFTYDGSSTLTRHLLNARRRENRVGYGLAKEFPESPRKIDAAISAVLAWSCRVDAISAGALTASTRKKSKRLYRF